MQKKPTKSQLLEFNLAILTQEYRETGRAAKGYKKLHAAILAGKEKWLANILRHHLETKEGVYLESEMDFRDETDYLIKFYSLLEVAMLAGFIPSRLPEHLRKEVITILDNPFVKKYYTINYPLLLPQVILKAALKNKAQKICGNQTGFRDLLLTDYKEDDDVEAFLALLDGFSYYGKNIDDFNRLLSNKAMITELLKRPRKDETLFEKAFWGFIKYSDYMNSYEELLRKCEHDLFRSAIWHYRSYWFQNMKILMKDKYVEGINNIKELASKVSFTEYRKNFKEGVAKRKPGKEIFDYGKSYSLWQKGYKKEVARLKKSVNYNLNSSHSKALKEYFKTI